MVNFRLTSNLNYKGGLLEWLMTATQESYFKVTETQP